jgi:hypothetical protein
MKELIKQTIQECLQETLNLLRPYFVSISPNLITYNSMSNESGLIVSYLTYNKSDEDGEFIEALVTIFISNDSVHFVADICRTPSEIIMEIVDKMIYTSNNENVLLEIESLCHQSGDAFFDYFKSIILSIRKKNE